MVFRVLIHYLKAYPPLHSSGSSESDLYIQSFGVFIFRLLISLQENPDGFQCIAPH